MKLLLIVTHKKNINNLSSELVKKNYRFTQIDCLGGFTKEKFVTIMLGVDNEKVEEVKNIVKKSCKSYEKLVSNGAPIIASVHEDFTEPAELVKIKVGGATIFVINLEEIVKL